MLSRLVSLRSRARRSVLRHRRLLAFILTAAAVLAGLGAVRPQPPVTVAVAVAARDLPAGAVLGPEDLSTASLPPAVVPDGLATAPLGHTLAAPVRRGEPVTDVRLVGPALTTAQPGLVALPVRFTDAAMAGLLRVGDRIHLLVTDATSGHTSSVADGVTVLAVPAPAEADQSGVMNQLSGRLVIVGITEGMVTAVTSAAVRGFLSFAYDH